VLPSLPSQGTVDFDTQLTMNFIGWDGTVINVVDSKTTTIPNAQLEGVYQIHHVLEIDHADIPTNSNEKGMEQFRFEWGGGANVSSVYVIAVEVSQYR
jgi:hypothetical protein